MTYKKYYVVGFGLAAAITGVLQLIRPTSAVMTAVRFVSTTVLALMLLLAFKLARKSLKS